MKIDRVSKVYPVSRILKTETFIFKILNWIDILNMNNLFVLTVRIRYTANKCKKGAEAPFSIQN